jgi:hypothetical protein
LFTGVNCRKITILRLSPNCLNIFWQNIKLNAPVYLEQKTDNYMKTLRNIAALALITASFAACEGNNGQKTIGGSVDTMNSVEGANAGNETTGSAMTNDTTAKRNGKGTGNGSSPQKDSTSNTEGNAKPDGRPQQ